MSIYQHFRKEEHSFIDQILEWREHVKNNYTYKLTDFLDPREQEMIKFVIGNDDEVKAAFFGGHDTVERKRALIYPSFFQINHSDFNVSLFEILYPLKFVKIEHPQVLGAMMSVGLKRGKFGDILSVDGRIQIVVDKDINKYLQLNLNSIGKINVKLKELPFDEIFINHDEWEEQTITTASLRLDVILSQVYRISRSKTQILIENQKVKVNWRLISETAFICQEGDIISTRGYGRCKILSIDGLTKKEKLRMIIGKQI